MRRGLLFLAIVVVPITGCLVAKGSSPATAAAAPSCTTASVRITDYNTVVGAGSVNDLFRIKNVSRQACSLRGYARVAYMGVYGIGTPYKDPDRLTVSEVRSYGRNGNDIGGLKKGLSIPTVTLQPDGGGASFWLAGTDEPHVNQQSRCIISYKMLVWLPGSLGSMAVPPLHANGFYWCGTFAAHPILPGESGSDPPMPLSYYFGTPG